MLWKRFHGVAQESALSNRRNVDLCPRARFGRLAVSYHGFVENSAFFGNVNENDTTKGLGPFLGRMQAHLGFVLRESGFFHPGCRDLKRFQANSERWRVLDGARLARPFFV
jgi:hypothetical protein